MSFAFSAALTRSKASLHSGGTEMTEVFRSARVNLVFIVGSVNFGICACGAVVEEAEVAALVGLRGFVEEEREVAALPVVRLRLPGGGTRGEFAVGNVYVNTA